MSENETQRISDCMIRLFGQHPDVWFRTHEVAQRIIKMGVSITKKTVGRRLDDLVYRYKMLETLEGVDLKERGIKTAHPQARYYRMREKPSHNRDDEKEQ